MAPYSMDLRTRVIKAFDTCGDAEEVAATFGVSRAWVHRLTQRRRETGSTAPRQQNQISRTFVRFLPPYSPDFNPIEQTFAKLKAFLRATRPRTFHTPCPR